MSLKYLDILREHNRIKASKCYICNKPTVDIIADGYKIKFVCKDHAIYPEPCQLFIENDGHAWHYIYPNGKKVKPAIPSKIANPHL